MGKTHGEEIAILHTKLDGYSKLIESGFKSIGSSIDHVKESVELVRESQKDHESKDQKRHEDTTNIDRLIMQSIQEYKELVAEKYVTKSRLKTVGTTIVTVRTILIALGSNLPNIIQAFAQ